MKSARWGVAALALLAAFLNILPRLFLPPGSDVLVHYSLIACFSRQVWEGNFYPRWCIDANAGLGGSDFLFYFPLPYYVTATFYPLKSFIGIEGIYLCGVFIASAVTFLTCRWWLADVTGKKIATAIAFLFLWLPYRSELLYYRSAYPELCEIALLPLLFLWLRRAASGRRPGWPLLAALVALMFFTHVPTALIALGAGSLYLLILSPAPRNLFTWIMGLAAGFAMCAIYAVPAEYFLSAMNPVALMAASHEWSGGFLAAANFLHQTQAAVADSMGLAALILIAILVMMRQRIIEDAFTRRETTAWCITGVILLFMLFPVSQPAWAVIKTIAGVAATPWRVQVILTFALIYFFAVYCRLMPPKAAKFATGNYALLVGFLLLMALFVTAMPSSNQALITELKNVHLMGIARSNQTRWTDAAASNPDALLTESKRKAPRVQILKGKGTAEVRQWNDDGIAIDTSLKQSGLISVHQFYFPLWHATVDSAPIVLLPQLHTGRILIAVPAGNHHIELHTSLNETLPIAWPLAKAISFAALLAMLIGYVRRRKLTAA